MSYAVRFRFFDDDVGSRAPNTHTASTFDYFSTVYIFVLAGLFVHGTPERVPGRQLCSLLRFAELQDELVGVSANRLIEHFGRARVRRIGEN